MTAHPHATEPATPETVLETGDDLVQLLTVAKYALAAGETEQAERAVDAALSLSRKAITELSEATLVARGSQTMLGYALRSQAAAAADPS
jgi:hypothetical protein